MPSRRPHPTTASTGSRASPRRTTASQARRSRRRPSRALRSAGGWVDADGRPGSAAGRAILGAPPGGLAAGAGIPELLTKTSIEKLTILSSGSFQANPVELIGSKKMESLVRELRERYSDRYVIFDSSPLLATTEPSVLTRLVDGIILVIRAGVTPRETVQQALATVDRDKVLGIVLNDLEFESGGLTSRYFGSPDYYYRQKDKEKESGQPPRSWRSLFPFFKKED